MVNDLNARQGLHSKKVLVTGGTGSFGSTMAQLPLTLGVAEVRILSRDEAKQDDLRRCLKDSRVHFYLGDVRDQQSVDEAIQGVDYVFHAAALKRVPSCEFIPQQAVATNVKGCGNVIRASAQHGVTSVVCLSTDKAVYPISAMGMSKALMEKVALAFARNNPGSQTVVSCVRYGNVMYSRGSVIPLFVEQLKKGEELTVTNPSMTRFLVSLEDSVDLVEHALLNAQPGDIFIRKSPASTIGTLAEAVARLFDVDPIIRVIGNRHAEKLFETLLSFEEFAKAEDLGAYYRVPLDVGSMNYSLFFEEGELNQNVNHTDYTSHNNTQLDVPEVTHLIGSLPEIQRDFLGASK